MYIPEYVFFYVTGLTHTHGLVLFVNHHVDERFSVRNSFALPRLPLSFSFFFLFQPSAVFIVRSLFYLLSNNHVNDMIMFDFRLEDEEVLSHFASFLKTLSLRLNPNTVQVKPLPCRVPTKWSADGLGFASLSFRLLFPGRRVLLIFSCRYCCTWKYLLFGRKTEKRKNVDIVFLVDIHCVLTTDHPFCNMRGREKKKKKIIPKLILWQDHVYNRRFYFASCQSCTVGFHFQHILRI